MHYPFKLKDKVGYLARYDYMLKELRDNIEDITFEVGNWEDVRYYGAKIIWKQEIFSATVLKALIGVV